MRTTTTTTTRDRTTGVPPRTTLRRTVGTGRIRLVLVAGLVVLGSVLVSSPSGAAVPVGTVYCYSNTQTSRANNVVGTLAFSTTNSIRVCVRAQSNRTWKISSVSPSGSHSEGIGYQWNGWNGNYQTGGVGGTSYTYFTRGSFRYCPLTPFGPYCIRNNSAWVKHTFTVVNNTTPTWSHTKGWS